MKDPLNPELLAALCHDLRGPLGAIGTWVHVLSSGRAKPETQTQALAAMSNDVRVMSGLIEHLSTLSSVLSGAQPVTLENVDIIPLLQAARTSAPKDEDFDRSFEWDEPTLSVRADKRGLGLLLDLLAGRGLTGRPGSQALRASRDGNLACLSVATVGAPRALSVALARALCESQSGQFEARSGGDTWMLTARLPLS